MAVSKFLSNVLTIWELIDPLVVLKRFEGVELLHATVASLHINLQGVNTLAPDGKDRQQGEGKR